MTIGIYSITHRESGKRYIGKSINIEQRFANHKSNMRSNIRSKDCNRHLWNAAQKYGVATFDFEIIEKFVEINEVKIAHAELFWMEMYNSTDRRCGYNLRRDSSTKMIVHEETKKIQSIRITGTANPNYGNKWSDEQKRSMAADLEFRRIMGRYTEETKQKISTSSKELWKDPAKKRQMAKNVSKAKEKYDFDQYSKDGIFIRRWESIKEIVEQNPEYKWQNIYSVCHGHKPSYRGFIWKQVCRNDLV